MFQVLFLCGFMLGFFLTYHPFNPSFIIFTISPRVVLSGFDPRKVLKFSSSSCCLTEDVECLNEKFNWLCISSVVGFGLCVVVLGSPPNHFHCLPLLPSVISHVYCVYNLDTIHVFLNQDAKKKTFCNVNLFWIVLCECVMLILCNGWENCSNVAWLVILDASETVSTETEHHLWWHALQKDGYPSERVKLQQTVTKK